MGLSVRMMWMNAGGSMRILVFLLIEVLSPWMVMLMAATVLLRTVGTCNTRKHRGPMVVLQNNHLKCTLLDYTLSFFSLPKKHKLRNMLLQHIEHCTQSSRFNVWCWTFDLWHCAIQYYAFTTIWQCRWSSILQLPTELRPLNVADGWNTVKLGKHLLSIWQHTHCEHSQQCIQNLQGHWQQQICYVFLLNAKRWWTYLLCDYLVTSATNYRVYSQLYKINNSKMLLPRLSTEICHYLMRHQYVVICATFSIFM